MKQKIIISLSVVVILLVGAILWFNAPLDLMDLDPGEVKKAVEPHISMPDFSYAEESTIYVEGKPGVKTSGFVNTSETDITIENVAEYAENECTIEYDNVTTFFDPTECVWKVHFSTTGMLGGDQTIYMDRKGKTILVVYGE